MNTCELLQYKQKVAQCIQYLPTINFKLKYQWTDFLSMGCGGTIVAVAVADDEFGYQQALLEYGLLRFNYDLSGSC